MKQLQQQCRSDRRIAAEMDLGQDDAAIPFATNRRPIIAHPHGDIHLSNRRANHGNLRCRRHVFDQPARREVRHHGSRPVPQHEPGRQREREILANRLPRIRHQRQSVDVRIHRKPNCRAGLKHEPFQVAEILGNRFRRTRKSAVGLEVDRADATAQPLEKRRHDDRAGTAHAVERDVKPAPPNSFDVEVRYREDTIDVSLNGTVVFLDRSELIPRRARNSLLDQRAHLDAFGVLEKQTGRPDALERVPLDRVVARRDHQPTRRVMVFHGELTGGRGRQANVDDVAADRLKRRQHDAMK